MTARPRIANRDARRLFLHLHGLSERLPSLDALFRKLAFVQLDSINTVARAHHMIIHARIPTYRPRDLDRLMVRDRKVFEHWTHDASVIHMDFFPYWRMRFQRSAERLRDRWQDLRRGSFHDKVDPVLERISETGPVSSSDVGEGERKGSGGWWDWHPSKTALEYLWHSGEIAVSHRKAFRKFYDLTHRVIPGYAREHVPDQEETIDWACNAALDRLGFATSGEIAAFFDKVTPAEARDWCNRELEEGRIIEVDIEGIDGKFRRSYARPDILRMVEEAPDPPGIVRILSPFDPVLRDRKRAERLFGFFYRIEVFVPAPQRQYGYYVFPVLEGDRLIGRVDMKAEGDCLNVTRFWPEKGVSMGKGRLDRFKAAVERTRRLADVSATCWAEDWLAPDDGSA